MSQSGRARLDASYAMVDRIDVRPKPTDTGTSRSLPLHAIVRQSVRISENEREQYGRLALNVPYRLTSLFPNLRIPLLHSATDSIYNKLP